MLSVLLYCLIVFKRPPKIVETNIHVLRLFCIFSSWHKARLNITAAETRHSQAPYLLTWYILTLFFITHHFSSLIFSAKQDTLPHHFSKTQAIITPFFAQTDIPNIIFFQKGDSCTPFSSQGTSLKKHLLNKTTRSPSLLTARNTSWSSVWYCMY